MSHFMAGLLLQDRDRKEEEKGKKDTNSFYDLETNRIVDSEISENDFKNVQACRKLGFGSQ